MAADQSEPVAGTLSITATPSNFSPAAIEFRLDTLESAPLVVDTTPPFTVTIDTTAVSRGKHVVWATGRDDRYTVWQPTSFTTRPNFVVVVVDDMDALTMPLWEALPKTKQAIGDRGTTFANVFAPDPICCPARGTLLTGDYAHNNGTLAGGYAGFVSTGAENDTVATRLQDAGYRTAFTGKYLNGYENDPSVVPPGWDEWFGLAGNMDLGYNYQANHNGTIESFGSSDADYQTDVLAARSTSFVNVTEAEDEQPFFLLVAPPRSARLDSAGATPREQSVH